MIQLCNIVVLRPPSRASGKFRLRFRSKFPAFAPYCFIYINLQSLLHTNTSALAKFTLVAHEIPFIPLFSAARKAKYNDDEDGDCGAGI